ncbi:DUF4397 domain-containing protein [Bacillus sp. 2205SS5-2]|uniref:DUF4397 domain-containing protein n=1 Tax=Bacillus sp. 2205SS5-2 TaxID=3109031 RepID=UPI003005F92D
MSQLQKYFEKATMYDLLACYYKYSDPNKHIRYYQKHLKNMNKAVQTQRSETTNYSNQPAYVRFFHSSPDAPNVDVYINANKVLKNVAFKDVSDYLSLPAGKYHIDIYPTGDSISTVISKKVNVEPGMICTLAVVGSVNKLQLKPYIDQPRVPHNETKVRFIHLSPDAPVVDIAVKGGDVIFPNVAYKQATEYLSLSAMTVDLEARIAKTQDLALSIPDVTLKPNEPYTIIATGFVGQEPLLDALIIK